MIRVPKQTKHKHTPTPFPQPPPPTKIPLSIHSLYKHLIDCLCTLNTREQAFPLGHHFLTTCVQSTRRIIWRDSHPFYSCFCSSLSVFLTLTTHSRDNTLVCGNTQLVRPRNFPATKQLSLLSFSKLLRLVESFHNPTACPPPSHLIISMPAVGRWLPPHVKIQTGQTATSWTDYFQSKSPN